MPTHTHLPHLSRIWISDPIYFITTCTQGRKSILANKYVAEILIDEWTAALERHGWLVGRYVIMPDHVHFFCSLSDNMAEPYKNNLSSFMQQWKQWTSKRILRDTNIDEGTKLSSPIWQNEYFDHLLRSEESYIQKWEYVRQNPMRKKLVDKAEDWSW
jgi:REP element-mobilizing transposase RayT